MGWLDGNTDSMEVSLDAAVHGVAESVMTEQLNWTDWIGKLCLSLYDLMDYIMQDSLLALSPEVCSNSCPLSWWCHLTISFSDGPSFALSLPNISAFSNESALCIRWPKYWSFSISPSNECSGLISFRIGWFDLLAVQGTLKNLQHHNWKASVLWHSAFFMVQLSHPYRTTGKKHSFN